MKLLLFVTLILLFICPLFGPETFAGTIHNRYTPALLRYYQSDFQSTFICSPDKEKVITGKKLTEDHEIVVDGLLNEEFWLEVPVANNFIQRTPNENVPASQRTEAKVAYTEDALYVGITAYDSSIDSVASTLFRRDGDAYSDWLYVLIDSYNDNRTAFGFAVNPKGVQKDILYYNDDKQDKRWNAVWEVRTRINDDSWSAEFRIPLSQIRFKSTTEAQTWGVNFVRKLARNEEESYWSPTPQNSSGIVSNFGTLNGLQNLSESTGLELLPYVSASLLRSPDEPNNSFYERNDFSGRIGGDIKYQFKSGLTFSGTVNPDFGQVEADPATINLTANEQFFSERRPFFLEGNDIFNFGSTETYNTPGTPSVFYSRRIGRSPQGRFQQYVQHKGLQIGQGNAPSIDLPDQTTILGAGKLSGKTKNGWSVGLLNSITASEYGKFRLEQGTPSLNGEYLAEPATNYLVSRVKKDFNKGNSVAGGFISATNRIGLSDSYLKHYLHENAYVGGVDYEHDLFNKNYTISSAFSVSNVNGSNAALLRTQESPARYLNRVDSEYLSIDSSLTTLSGYASEISFQKNGGDYTRFSLTYNDVSPGYETNDLGFITRADARTLATAFLYQRNDFKKLRYFQLALFNAQQWNYDQDKIGQYFILNGVFQFNNLWAVNYNLNYTPESFDDRLTRGGPLTKSLSSLSFDFNISSDQTKSFSYSIGSFHRREFNSDDYNHVYFGGISYRPTSFLQLNLSPDFRMFKSHDQYVTTIKDDLATETYGNRYVFAHLDQNILSLPLRVDWTFSPTISLESYFRPFISSGKFYNYKELSKPKTYQYNNYGKFNGSSVQVNNGLVTIDADGPWPSPEFAFSEPDFTFSSFQANVVFRWEFSPGSTAFLVWQQLRNDYQAGSDFHLQNNFGNIIDSEPTNIFLLKITYWFSR